MLHAQTAKVATGSLSSFHCCNEKEKIVTFIHHHKIFRFCIFRSTEERTDKTEINRSFMFNAYPRSNKQRLLERCTVLSVTLLRLQRSLVLGRKSRRLKSMHELEETYTHRSNLCPCGERQRERGR